MRHLVGNFWIKLNFFYFIAAVCAHKESLPEEDGGLGKNDNHGPGTEIISKGHI